jgi:uncharacterized membrane protein YdbT with pleckstrin-like domain
MDPIKNTKSVIEHLQPSVAVLVIRILVVLFVLDTAYAWIILSYSYLIDLHSWHNSYIAFIWIVHTVKYILLSGIVIRLFADWAGRRYFISDRNTIERVGLINTTESTYDLARIESVAIMQSWLGRRLNYGTIKLTLANSGTRKEISIREINGPYRYKEYFDPR